MVFGILFVCFGLVAVDLRSLLVFCLLGLCFCLFVGIALRFAGLRFCGLNFGYFVLLV